MRKTASLPDTPCASSSTETMPNASTVSSVVADVRLLPPIFCVARVARFIEVASGRKDAVGVFRVDRIEGRLGRGDHLARRLGPVAFVEDATTHQEEVAGLDERRRAVADRRPLFVVPRSKVLYAAGRARGSHRLVNHVGARRS